MNIYYSIPLNVPVDAEGEPLQSIPEIAYGDRMPLLFTALGADGLPVDLSAAVSWQFDLDVDRSGATTPMFTTTEIAFTAATASLSCTVNARTIAFLEAVDGRSQVCLIAEMSGFDAGGNRIFRFPWNMAGVMPVNADRDAPDAATGGQAADFTAFRVYADETDDHTQSYPIGSHCPQFVPANILFRHESVGAMPEKLQELYQTIENPSAEQIRNALGYIGGRAVPKSMTERFVLLAKADWQSSDVEVDWGDGTRSLMRNGKTPEARGDGFHDSSDYEDDWCDSHFMFSHTYAASGSYYVKITGRDYWGIRHYYSDLKNADGTSKYPDSTADTRTPFNLVYDCLGHDTPVASCVRNLASFMNGSSRLLHLMMTETGDKSMTAAANWTSAFLDCANLVSARGFYFAGYNLTGNQTVQRLFQRCTRLEIFDGTLPAYCTSVQGYRYIFQNCSRLRADIAGLLPSSGFLCRRIRALELFLNCSSLTGTVPADLLWNDTGIVWSDTANAFRGCSADLRAQVPVSWGGTLAQEAPNA
jgi:hypothetical protein